MGKTLNKWLFDYKLLHVFFWCLIGLFLYVTDYDADYNRLLYIGQSVLVPLFSCIPFYLTAYLLVPRLLYQKQYLKLVGCILAVLFLLVPAQILVIRFLLHFADSRLAVIPPADAMPTVYYMGVWNNLLCIFIAGGLKIMSDRFKLEKEKISTELNFLRAQINPHFLFNMLNTIYFQVDKSNVHARASIEKLSEMLRYQLYECVHDRIEVEKEINYLKSYVAMQRLRLEEGTDIRLDVDQALSGYYIAPLLIQPLVENAFKYLSHHKEAPENKVHISLNRKDNRIVVEVCNSRDKATYAEPLLTNGGIGNKNLERRLELLYPGSHQIKSNSSNGTYTVTLSFVLFPSNYAASSLKREYSGNGISSEKLSISIKD